MLRELQIENFAIIDHLQVEFAPGFNVLSGETGAGKSIVLNALSLLCGGRFDKDGLRDAKKPVLVQGIFEVPSDGPFREVLESLGLEDSEKECILTREITPTGKNRCLVNRHLVRVADLKELSPYIFNIHSQHETHRLLEASQHDAFLLQFGKEELLQIHASFKKKYLEYIHMKNRCEEREELVRKHTREKSILEAELEEISSAGIYDGEEEELARRHEILVHQKEIEALLSGFHEGLDASLENSATAILSRMEREVLHLQKLSPSSSFLVNSFAEVMRNIEEFKSFLGDYEASLSSDDTYSLDEVESRLSVIESLKRKYGGSVKQILEYEKNSAERLFELEKELKTLKSLDSSLETLKHDLVIEAQKLSSLRKKVAIPLEKKISEILHALCMPKAKFEVRFLTPENPQIQSPSLGANGLETVEFWLQSNQGEEIQPLYKIASGGEMSRVMLAMKAVFSAVHPARTFVFDEIDSGIGGETAHAIAQTISTIASQRQCIVITHLAQVAVRATHHLLVEKRLDGERTVSGLRVLNPMEIRQELARMMGVSESKDAQNMVLELEKIAGLQKQ